MDTLSQMYLELGPWRELDYCSTGYGSQLLWGHWQLPELGGLARGETSKKCQLQLQALFASCTSHSLLLVYISCSIPGCKVIFINRQSFS